MKCRVAYIAFSAVLCYCALRSVLLAVTREDIVIYLHIQETIYNVRPSCIHNMYATVRRQSFIRKSPLVNPFQASFFIPGNSEIAKLIPGRPGTARHTGQWPFSRCQMATDAGLSDTLHAIIMTASLAHYNHSP